jgi:hypothetical protein
VAALLNSGCNRQGSGFLRAFTTFTLLLITTKNTIMKKLMQTGKSLTRKEKHNVKGGFGGTLCYFICLFPNGSGFKFDAQGTCDWFQDPCLAFGAQSAGCRCV